MNCPGTPRSSQARRMGFQMSGAICHSSSSRGVAPSSRAAGSMLAARRAAAAASSSASLAAQWRPVQVFPQARGPAISTAGDAPSAATNSSSTTLPRYPVGASPGRTSCGKVPDEPPVSGSMPAKLASTTHLWAVRMPIYGQFVCLYVSGYGTNSCSTVQQLSAVGR